jgi:lipopolysaccharide transport system ATP-binding protein
MSRSIIDVTNLGKSYVVRHEGQPRSLRGAVKDTVKRTFRTVRAGGSLWPARETFWALRDVSFEVEAGTCVGIIGRNGAGKSTLLKILSRIVRPTVGEARIRGRVASLLEVGTGFHPELTGRENIYLNGSVLGMKKAEVDRKFDEIVDFAGVERFIDTPVKHYSSGMQTRLGFAVAAHLDPDVLIVDEVLAVGDAEFQRKCMGKMREVATGQGRTILLVSHNLASIASLASRCLYLKDGELVTAGPTDEVIDRYMQQVGSALTSLAPGHFAPLPREDGRPNMLRSMEFFSNGRRTNTTLMGHDLSVQLTLDGRAHRELSKGVIGLAIETPTGQRVISIGSGQAGFRFANEPSEFIVTCQLGRIPLNQGRYLMSVVIAEGQAAPIERHDSLGEFEILASDVFGHGQLLSAQQGFIYWKAQWKQVEPILAQ